MPLPVIGLTTSHDLTRQDLPAVVLLRAYVETLVSAGGAPLLLPSALPQEAWPQVYERLDGILFTGGGDIATERFGGEPHPRVSLVDPQRDALELWLLETAAREGKPFLGICRGCQVINVALGGGLYTDIKAQMPGALKHDYYPNYPRDYLAHPLALIAGSLLAELLGEIHLEVNSLHHQGINKIAPELHAVGYSPDGLVEALEMPGHPFGFAVQWHPEWLPDQSATQTLLKSFVEACRQK